MGSGLCLESLSSRSFLPQFYDSQYGLLAQFLVMADTLVGIEVVVEVVIAGLCWWL